MRTIDADALIKWVQECGDKCPTLSVEKLFNTIKDAPTIDAVPVVRCKDCKWKIVTMLKENYCLKYEDIVKGDYFCADGERSEDEKH